MDWNFSGFFGAGVANKSRPQHRDGGTSAHFRKRPQNRVGWKKRPVILASAFIRVPAWFLELMTFP